MIETPTVFILGAGASMPYGYPSGQGLVDKIQSNLSEEGGNSYKKLIEKFKREDIEKLRYALFYSGKSSVDAFLEHRTEFKDIGKLSMALELIPHEIPQKLFNNASGKWYTYFYNRLNTSFEDFHKNKFSVITFNYDRSFEQFLFMAIKNSYGKSDEECAEKIKKIPIIHVHGKLGNLPWEGGKTREYHGNLNVDLSESSEGIRIIHDAGDDDVEFEKARKELDKAENIYFLGFGYNATNLRRLDITSYLDKTIKGTAVDIATSERNSIYKIIPHNKINLGGYDALNFLRNLVNFE